MSLTTRHGTRTDVPAIVDLWSTSAGPTRQAGGATAAERLIDHDGAALIVAERDDVVIGTVIVGWDGWRCHLYRMAVSPTERRAGVGAALVDAALQRASDLGAARLDAMVNTENHGAIDFWEAAGFELDEQDRRWSLLLARSPLDHAAVADPSPAVPAEPRYAMAGIERNSEATRLKQLEDLNDAYTLRRVDAIGVDTGWRCLEVGAGAGSIATALAERTGPTGLVVAADIDPRLLRDFPGAGREVTTHDLTNGPVEPADFDFAHCRAVLAHVEDLDTAVQHLVASVRPGGWVLCEEADYGAMEACDPNHRHAPHLAAFQSLLTEGRLMNAFSGRHTFEALRRAGLTTLTSDSHGALGVGGTPRARYRIHTLEHLRPRLLADGLSEASLGAMFEMFADPSFTYVDNPWFAAWGQTPKDKTQ